MFIQDAEQSDDSCNRLFQLRHVVQETQQVEANLAHGIRPPDRARDSMQYRRPQIANKRFVSQVSVPASPARSILQNSMSRDANQTSRATSPSAQSSRPGQSPASGTRCAPPVCWQFRDTGKCHRGADCRFLHTSETESPKRASDLVEQASSCTIVEKLGQERKSALDRSNHILGSGLNEQSQHRGNGRNARGDSATDQEDRTRNQPLTRVVADLTRAPVERCTHNSNTARVWSDQARENRFGLSKSIDAKLQESGVAAEVPSGLDGEEHRQRRFMYRKSRSLSQNVSRRPTRMSTASPLEDADRTKRTDLEELQSTCLAEDEAVLRKLDSAPGADSQSRTRQVFAQKVPRIPRFSTSKALTGNAVQRSQTAPQQAGPARLRASLQQLKEEMRLLQLVMREDDESLQQQVSMLQEGMSQLRARSRARSGNTSLASTAVGTAISSPCPLSPSSEKPAPSPERISAALSRIAEVTTPH